MTSINEYVYVQRHIGRSVVDDDRYDMTRVINLVVKKGEINDTKKRMNIKSSMLTYHMFI